MPNAAPRLIAHLAIAGNADAIRVETVGPIDDAPRDHAPLVGEHIRSSGYPPGTYATHTAVVCSGCRHTWPGLIHQDC